MRIGAVVLAAGAGTRMGGVAKALLPAGGATFLARIAATARAAGVSEIAVIVGPPFAAEVSAAAHALDAMVLVNSDPSRGMASSVAIGFGALATRGGLAPTAALLWPVDHPWVETATVVALCDRGEGVPVRGERGGHPALIPRRLYKALAGCAADAEGARGVLRGAIARIAVDDDGVLADVDRPGDLVRPCVG